jgi:hypothetical protein
LLPLFFFVSLKQKKINTHATIIVISLFCLCETMLNFWFIFHYHLLLYYYFYIYKQSFYISFIWIFENYTISTMAKKREHLLICCCHQKMFIKMKTKTTNWKSKWKRANFWKQNSIYISTYINIVNPSPSLSPILSLS